MASHVPRHLGLQRGTNTTIAAARRSLQYGPGTLSPQMRMVRWRQASTITPALAPALRERNTNGANDIHKQADQRRPVDQRHMMATLGRIRYASPILTRPLGRHLPALSSSFSTALRPQSPDGSRPLNLLSSTPLLRTFCTVSRLSPQAGIPQSHLAHPTPTSRSPSTASRTRPKAGSPLPHLRSSVGLQQHRTLFGSSWRTSSAPSASSQNLLAHVEQTANNNPTSATAQNAFYQALLRANMPDILVERYSTGRYATNSACDSAYSRALERIGAAETAMAAGSIGQGIIPAALGQSQAQGNRLSSDQLQVIGQAVAARSYGGNVSVSKQGSGARNEPLYVVVDESLGSTIFKWVRFVLVFGVTAYFVMVLFTLVVEATGLLRKVGGAQNSEAKPEEQTTRFSDVQGCDEAKEELQELVEFLKSPERFSTLGGKLPKGVLLVGPPGTGKTLLARAVAGEAGVPFFYMSGSEFDEVYVGVGAKRVRELFAAARAKAPSIIFIDELDAIGTKRNERDAAYAKQTLNQLLTELDGFDQSATGGVIIIGATNFPQSLDKALTRPGRFDRNVAVPLPDVRGRLAILQHHLRKIKVDAAVDPAIIARGCPGFSGAELENIVNQAAIRASKNRSETVSLDDLVWAKDKILMGSERRSAVIQQKDRVMTAYHEGGHALVAMLTDASTPLYKATIMPRGHALGITQMLPNMDKVSDTKKELMAQIDVCMGGKVAEELVYGPENVTTGASSDITSATRIAYMMVTQAGMSEALGNIDLSSDYARLSSETKQLIEHEVRRLVEDGRERAWKLLTTNRVGLDRLASALVEYETLSKEDMEKAVRGERLPETLLKVDPKTAASVLLGKIPEPTDAKVSILPVGFAGPGAVPAVVAPPTTTTTDEAFVAPPAPREGLGAEGEQAAEAGEGRPHPAA